MILQSVRKNALALALFALITALVLSSVNSLTADRIANAERIVAQKALLEIVPRIGMTMIFLWILGPFLSGSGHY